MPVYNGGQTLQRSLASLLRQGDVAMELIVVNDCSTDNTQEVLEEFAHSAPNNLCVRVIKHDTNGGVAVARNTALSHATGKYIMWLDADDYFSDYAFQKLIALPESDVVSFGYTLQYETKERIIEVPKQSNPWKTFKHMAEGKLKWNLWAFMVRRDLIERHQIRFIPQHNMGEDLYFMGQVLLHADTIQTLDSPLYHYITFNSDSLTNNYKPKHFEDMQVNINSLESVVIAEKGVESQQVLNYLKLTLKLPLLYTIDTQQYQMWQEMFPEANDSIATYPTPHLYNRWLQQWAKSGQFWLLKLFNYLYSFVYSLRY